MLQSIKFSFSLSVRIRKGYLIFWFCGLRDCVIFLVFEDLDPGFDPSLPKIPCNWKFAFPLETVISIRNILATVPSWIPLFWLSLDKTGSFIDIKKLDSWEDELGPPFKSSKRLSSSPQRKRSKKSVAPLTFTGPSWKKENELRKFD